MWLVQFKASNLINQTKSGGISLIFSDIISKSSVQIYKMIIIDEKCINFIVSDNSSTDKISF